LILIHLFIPANPIAIADVEDIKYVINFDYPNCSEDYVHRIGRTGRRDNKGVAYTFFSDEDEKQSSDLVKVLQQSKQDIHPQLLAMSQRHHGGRGRQWGGWTKRRADFGYDNRDNNKRRRFDGKFFSYIYFACFLLTKANFIFCFLSQIKSIKMIVAS
jgi:superfamily II DNA/RNA helicase